MTTEAGLEVRESGKPLNVEPGLYPGAVNAIDEIDEDYGPQWRFEFRLDGYPDEAPWAWASTKSGLGTRTKIYRWATVLLGRPLTLGERVLSAQLIDLRCNILIKDKIDSRGEMRRGVDDILSLKPAGTNVASPLEDKCFCGKPVNSYGPTGTPLCVKHAKELALAE
jgi:hypothetical protein